MLHEPPSRWSLETLLSEAEVALTMDEARVAELLLDHAARALKKADVETSYRVLRRRAEVALDEAIDDDASDLASVARRCGDAAGHPLARDDDAERHAFACVLARQTGRARKATRGDALVAAAIRYASRPSERGAAALFEAAGDDPDRLERAVRLVAPRQLHPVVEHARRWAEATDAARPPWDRGGARAFRAWAGELRLMGDREGARAVTLRWVEAVESALPADDPRRLVATSARLVSAPPADALAARAARVGRLVDRYGPASPLVEPALWALSSDAVDAKAHVIACAALERLDAMLAARRGKEPLGSRPSVLRDWRREAMALRDFDTADRVVAREEEVARLLGQPVPLFLARADVAYARGDLAAWVEGHEQELARCLAGPPPELGPEGARTRTVRAWTRMALEKVGRHEDARRLV